MQYSSAASPPDMSPLSKTPAADLPWTASPPSPTNCWNAPQTPGTTPALSPTQLHKILTATAHSDPAGHAALQALTCFDAILVGGAALAPELLRQATDAGARLVRTYGASETAGGCVYDGVPLPGARVEIEDATGRIWLGGDTIATGYLNKPHHVAWQRPGWFCTDDHGHWDTHPHPTTPPRRRAP
ncbi:MAG: AMP-binding protein [Lawsonella clevelandensis]